MINIIDDRFCNSCRLDEIADGDCFILGGILFRKLHSDSSFGNAEYMYSGVQLDIDTDTMVTPVDVTIIITNEGLE